jgi:pectinesterase
MGAHIAPEGWHNWGKPERERTVKFCEYGSSGPGAAPDRRVGWSIRLSDEEADMYTVARVLAGEDGWNPEKECGRG